MDVLPVWLQWAVSLATVLSSIGVFVALLQLKVSGDQANKQLQLSERQFNLINQGFLQTTFNSDFFTINNMVAQQEDLANPETLLMYIFPVVTLQNVGNLPVFYFFEYFKVIVNGAECYHTPPEIFDGTDNMLFPKQSLPLMLGRVFFNEAHSGLTFQQVQELNFTCRIKISYKDFNDDSSPRKVIDHEMLLSGVFFIYTKNHANNKPTAT